MKVLVWLLPCLVFGWSANAWDIYVDKKGGTIDAFLDKKKYSVQLPADADVVRSDSDTIYTMSQAKRSITLVKKSDFNDQITSVPFQSYSLDSVLKQDEYPKSFAVYEEGDAVLLYILAYTSEGDEFVTPLAFTKIREGRFPLDPESDFVKNAPSDSEPVRSQNFVTAKPFSVVGGEDIFAMKDPQTRGVTVLVLDNEAASIHKYSGFNAYNPSYQVSFPMPKGLISKENGELIDKRDFAFSQLAISPYSFQVMSESNYPTRVANISLIEMEKDLAVLRSQILQQQINEIYGNTWVKKVLGWGALSSLIDYFDKIYGNPNVDIETELIENKELLQILNEQSPEEVMEWMVESQIFTAEEIDQMRTHYRIENFRGKKWSTIAAVIGTVVVVRHLHVLRNPNTKKGFAMVNSIIGKAYKFTMETLVRAGAITPDRAEKVTKYFKSIIPNFQRRMIMGRYATEYDPVALRKQVTREADHILKQAGMPSTSSKTIWGTKGVPYRYRQLRLEQMIDDIKGIQFADEGFKFPAWIHNHLPKAEALEGLVSRGIVRIPSIKGATRQKALETIRRALVKHADKLDELENYSRLRKTADRIGARIMTPQAKVAQWAEYQSYKDELALKIDEMKAAGKSADEIAEVVRRYEDMYPKSAPDMIEYLRDFKANHDLVGIDPEQFYREGLLKFADVADEAKRSQLAMEYAVQKVNTSLDMLGVLVTKSQKASYLGALSGAYDDYFKAVKSFDEMYKALPKPRGFARVLNDFGLSTAPYDDIISVNKEIKNSLSKLGDENFKKVHELYGKLGEIARSPKPDKKAYGKLVDELAELTSKFDFKDLQSSLEKLTAIVDPTSPYAISLKKSNPKLFNKLSRQGAKLKEEHIDVFNQLAAARAKLSKAARELKKTEDMIKGEQIAYAKKIVQKLADSFLKQKSWGGGVGNSNPFFEAWAKLTEYWAGLMFARPVIDKSSSVALKEHFYDLVFTNIMPKGDDYFEAVVKGKHVVTSLTGWSGEMIFDTWGACMGRNQAIDESEHCMGDTESHVLKLPGWFPKFGGQGIHYEMVARTINNTIGWWLLSPVGFARQDTANHRKVWTKPNSAASDVSIEIFKGEGAGVGIISRQFNSILKGFHPINFFKGQLLYDYPWRTMAKNMAISEYKRMHADELDTPEGQQKLEEYIKAVSSRSSSILSIFERKIFGIAISMPYVNPQYEIKGFTNDFLNKLAGNTWPGKAIDFFVLPFTSAFKGGQYYGDYFGFNHPEMVGYMKEMGQSGILEKIDPDGYSDLTTWTQDELMWFFNFVIMMEIERYRQEVPMPDVHDTEGFAAWFNQVYENLFGAAEKEIKEYVEKVKNGEDVSLGQVRFFKIPEDGRKIDPPRYLEQAKQYIELFKTTERAFRTFEETEQGDLVVEVNESTELDKTLIYTELLGQLTKTNATITKTLADLNDNTETGNRLRIAARNLGFLDASYMIMTTFGSQLFQASKGLSNSIAASLRRAYMGGFDHLTGRSVIEYIDPVTGHFYVRKEGGVITKIDDAIIHSAHATKNLFAKLAYYSSLLEPGKEFSFLKMAHKTMKSAKLPPKVRQAALRNTHLLVKAAKAARSSKYMAKAGKYAKGARDFVFNPWTIGLASVPAYFWFKNQMDAHSRIHVEISKLLVEVQKLIHNVSETLVTQIAQAKMEALKVSGEFQGALATYKEDVQTRKDNIKTYLQEAHDEAYHLCTNRWIRGNRVISENGIVVFGIVGGAWLFYKGASLASTKVFKVNPFGWAKRITRINVSPHWRSFASYTISSALIGWVATNQINEGINNQITMRSTELFALYNAFYMTLVESEVLKSIENSVRAGEDIQQSVFYEAREKALEDEDFVQFGEFINSLRNLENGARCSQ